MNCGEVIGKFRNCSNNFNIHIIIYVAILLVADWIPVLFLVFLEKIPEI